MYRKTALFAVAALFSANALVGADCQKHPEDQWMSKLDLQKKIVNEGTGDTMRWRD